jgi:hypothetical protein
MASRARHQPPTRRFRSVAIQGPQPIRAVAVRYPANDNRMPWGRRLRELAVALLLLLAAALAVRLITGP